MFLGPVWINKEPDKEIVQKYFDIVKMYNDAFSSKSSSFKEMKSPVLTLNFRDVGEVTVIQSALYYLENDMQKVIEKSHQIVEMFKCAGFEILREKIEASADGINGIPQTDEDASLTTKYFEFHIRVNRKIATNNSPITEEENASLLKISNELSQELGIPVPLSYNRTKEVSGDGFQRFLNVRFRSKGQTN